MTFRPLLLTALLLAASSAAIAEEKEDTIASPVLRAQVTVESDIVRVGDVIENAGTAAQIAIYRSPDLGTTGSLPTGCRPALLMKRVSWIWPMICEVVEPGSVTETWP